jgi:hypothetical protein
MAKQRATFGKRERERERLERAKAKQERRATRSEGGDDPTPEPEPIDEGAILAELAALHEAFEKGQVPPDEFAARRDELTASLRVD